MGLMLRRLCQIVMTAGGVLLAGCAATNSGAANRSVVAAPAGEARTSTFEQDRQAILAMAGNYHVTFDFIETVSFDKDYALKDRKRSGGEEIVRVIADEGDFISLQHILVVGGEKKFAIKHWRQDWRYQPSSVLVFIGGAAWETKPVSASEAKGAWSQTVYQVDNAPRYGAVGKWSHDEGYSSWTPKAEWRPLPRRDATKRDDYQAVEAINQHTITPFGWVHEQNNTKLILTGPKPKALVREIGVNTYKRGDDFDVSVGDDYWAATKDYWAAVRAEWTRLETDNVAFGLTIQGEPAALYVPLLELADDVKDGEKTTDAAIAEAKSVIAEFTTTDIGSLADRVGKAEASGEAY